MTHDAFELTRDGKRLTAHVFGMTFFVGGALYDAADALRRVHDGWLDFVGPERFTFYATETMSKHRKVSRKTLQMLPGWLDPATGRREYLALMLKDGESHDDTGRVVFEVFSNERQAAAGTSDKLAYLHLALPADEAEARLDDLAAIFSTTCEALPVVSASAGYGIETGAYYQQDGQTHAWGLSMRHPGLDIFTGLTERRGVGLDGLKSVNWLTMIGPTLLEEFGGLAALRADLPDGVALDPLPAGVILRAGPAPGIGDVNRRDTLPLYAAVDRALKPAIERCIENTLDLDVTGDDGSYTERWFRRFETAAP